MVAKTLLSRITIDPAIFGGKPIIRGQRLAVEHVLGMLAAGDTIETILQGYDWLERDDVLACLEYARLMVNHHRTIHLEAEDERQDAKSKDVMTPEQRAAVLEVLEEIESLPYEPEPEDGLVGSRNHDEILYVRSPKVLRRGRPDQ